MLKLNVMKFIFDIHIEIPNPQKILLLDRDGVIIRDTGYPYLKSKIIFEEKNIKNIIKIKNIFPYDSCGFITNQSGVARNIFTEEEFWECHKFIMQKCHELGLIINFTAVNFFKNDSYFRKPDSGMIEQTKMFFNAKNKNLLFIGDRKTDRLAADKSGIKFLNINKI